MKAMILAAGLGKRMRPLTQDTPKPLLKVNGRPLIEYHLLKLAEAGIKDVVINTAHLAEKIENHIGDGAHFNLNVVYSRETKPLETAGGIRKALSLLGDEPFIVINGDVWTDYPFANIIAKAKSLNDKEAYLVMVENPEENKNGDYGVEDGLLVLKPNSKISYTFSGISAYSPSFFQRSEGVNRLADLFNLQIENKNLKAEVYRGEWLDIGTPERLLQLNQSLL